MKRSILLAIAAGLLIAANSTNELEGRWLGGIWVFNGGLVFGTNVKDPVSTLDVTREAVEFRVPAQGKKERWSYKLDPQVTPKAIDLMTETGEKRLGIYEISHYRYGNQRLAHLKLCYAPPGADRPKSFHGKSSDGTLCHEFAPYPER